MSGLEHLGSCNICQNVFVPCTTFQKQFLQHSFHFSTQLPNSFKHFHHNTPDVRQHERIDCCDRCISHRNNTRPGRSSSTTRSRPQPNFNFTPNIVLLHDLVKQWTHLGLNEICAKSFCPPKTNYRMLFLYGMLSAATLHIIVIKPTAGTQN